MRAQISSLLYYTLHRLFRLMPINRKLIVFESQGDFSDNSWALYDYMRKLGKYHFVWIVSERSKFHNTSDTTFLGFYNIKERIRIIKSLETAIVCFNTHGTCCNYHRRNNQKIVTLWHGTALKADKGGYSHHFDYCIVIGPDAIYPQTRFLSAPKEKMLPLGNPRNDLLVLNAGCGVDNPFCPQMDVKKLILWMPTFRASNLECLSENSLDSETGLPLLTSDEKVSAFNDFLRENKVVFLIKIHRLQASKSTFRKHFSNIVFISDEDLFSRRLQLYQIVGKSDALLSDYSSIVIDYWIVNKPEGFILDDIEGYRRSRGFIYENILEYLPGHHIYDQQQLREFVLSVCRGDDPFYEQRVKLREKFHIALDGSACQRICAHFNLDSKES